MLLNALNFAIEQGRRVVVNLFLGVIQQVQYALVGARDGLAWDGEAGRENSWMPPHEQLRMGNSKLSFFDNFSIVSGIPTFQLNPCKKRPGGGECKDNVKLRLPEDIEYERAKAERKLTCCSFSVDGSRLASGHNDGTLTIWSTDNGTELSFCEALNLKTQIADIRFFGGTNHVVVFCCFQGWYGIWDSRKPSNSMICVDCSHHWEDVDLLAPVVGLPQFSADTKQICFPVTSYRDLSQKYPMHKKAWFLNTAIPHAVLKFQQEIWLYVFDLVQDESIDLEPVCVLNAVRNTKDAMFSTTGVFSSSSKGFLVGLTSRAKHIIKIWPDFVNAPKTSYTCRGTHGCWSPADDYILTWAVDLKYSHLDGSARSCSLWRLDCLVSEHDDRDEEQSVKSAKELEFTEDGDIFWAQFIPRLHKKLGVATCVVNEHVVLLLWDALEGRVIHRLQTGISRDQTHFTRLQAWDNEWFSTQHSYGLHPVSVSGDGNWIGVYSSEAKKGTIWDATSGIEVLCFTSPDPSAGNGCSPDVGMDMLFSQTGSRFLLCNENEIVLWLTPSLCSFSTEAGVHALALECPETMGTIAPVICKFSQDGCMFGVCKPYAEKMRVWELEHGLSYVLARKGDALRFSPWELSQRLQRNRTMAFRALDESNLPYANKQTQFCQFAFSRSGQMIVTCMADSTLLLWNLTKEKYELSNVNLPVLKSKYFPAWSVCFSVDKMGSDTIVVCEDTGVLFWVDVKSGKALARKTGGGIEKSWFSADGSRGLLVESSQTVHVWDLITRQKLQQVNYRVPIGTTGSQPFGQNFFMSGNRSFVGIPKGTDFLSYGQRGVMCFPDTTEKDLMKVGKVARSVVVTERSDWIIVDKFIDADTQIFMGETQEKGDIHIRAEEGEDAEFGTYYPDAIDYGTEEWNYIWRSDVSSLDAVEELTILNVDGKGTTKILKGEGLLAKQSLSVSPDGRRVACVMENGKVMVWSPFAVQGCIPDYNDLVVLKGAPDKEEVLRLLDSHGPCALNMPDWNGKTIPFHVITNGEHEIFKILATWAVKSRTKISLSYCSIAHKKSCDKSHGMTTMLDVAVNLRHAILVEVLLHFLGQGLATAIDTSDIYRTSLIKVARIYPDLFYNLLAADSLMMRLPEIAVPEYAFQGKTFRVATSKYMLQSDAELHSMWMENINTSRSGKLYSMRNTAQGSRLIPAVPAVIPFPNIAEIGNKGLLKQLLVLKKKRNQMYSTFVVKAIIYVKWKAYGFRLLLEEVFHYNLLWVFFTAYGVFLGHLWHIGSFLSFFKQDYEGEERESATANTAAGIFLVSAWSLAILSLSRELVKLSALWYEDGLSGIVYWTKSVWNWLELSAHLLLIVVIVPAHYSVPRMRDVEHTLAQRQLTVAVAIQSALLALKGLHHAQGFRATGHLVIMIRQTVREIKSFLLLLILLMFGHAIAFFVLFRVPIHSMCKKEGHTCAMPPPINSTAVDFETFKDCCDNLEDAKSRFGNVGRAFVTTFSMMLGETHLDSLWAFDDSYLLKGVGIILFMIYLMGVMVVLLNLLIAVMGHLFTYIKENEELHFLKGRAQIIDEVESMVSQQKKEECSKKTSGYLHILVPRKLENKKLSTASFEE